MLALLLSFAVSGAIRPRIPSKIKVSQMKLNIAPNADSCSMCTTIIDYVEMLLNSSIVESEITALVALACKTLPVPLDIGCTFIVDHYIPLIIQYIESGIESIDICSKVGFCSTKQTIAFKRARLPKLNKVSRKSPVCDAQTCLMCKKVISYVEAAIEDDKIEEQVIEVVDQVCKTFPLPLDSLCSAIIKASIPTIINWLKSGIEALDVCYRLGFCEE